MIFKKLLGLIVAVVIVGQSNLALAKKEEGYLERAYRFAAEHPIVTGIAAIAVTALANAALRAKPGQDAVARPFLGAGLALGGGLGGFGGGAGDSPGAGGGFSGAEAVLSPVLAAALARANTQEVREATEARVRRERAIAQEKREAAAKRAAEESTHRRLAEQNAKLAAEERKVEAARIKERVRAEYEVLEGTLLRLGVEAIQIERRGLDDQALRDELIRFLKAALEELKKQTRKEGLIRILEASLALLEKSQLSEEENKELGPKRIATIVSAALSREIASLRDEEHEERVVIDSVRHNEHTPLTYAIERRDVATVRSLLEGGADPYERGLNGRTPSEYAYGCDAIITLLAEAMEKAGPRSGESGLAALAAAAVSADDQ